MRAKAQVAAFSLVEVTLALGVAAISLLVIFSLLPIGLQTSQRSIGQTAAVDILSAVVADIRTTQPGITASPQFNIPIPANPLLGPTPAPVLYFNAVGQASAALQPDSRYQVTITFLAASPTPAGSPARTATLANLRISWPAAANPTNSQGSAEIFAAFDRN